MIDIKGSQENHTHERDMLSRKFLQVLENLKKKHLVNCSKTKVNSNALEQIFKLLGKLESKKEEEGIKFVSEFLKTRSIINKRDSG